jgi:hypothetical protein
MKLRIPSRKNYYGVVTGLEARDQLHLDKYDNAQSVPQTNILSAYSEDEEDEEQKLEYVCVDCSSKLDYDRILHRYKCGLCGTHLDINNDRLLTKADQKNGIIYVSSNQKQYAQYDELDKTQPFLESIDVNKDLEYNEDNPDIQLVREQAGGRIRHYKCRGLPTEALRMVNEYEDR